MTNPALRVPRNDIETVKRLGAQWNATDGSWYVPEGPTARRSLAGSPPTIPDAGPRVPSTCFCSPIIATAAAQTTAPVVGIWFEQDLLDGYEFGMLEECGGWFLQYDEMSADVIATACPDDVLAAHGAGPLRWRTTRVCLGYSRTPACSAPRARRLAAP